MVLLGKQATGWLPMSNDAPHRSTALSHAWHHDRPGLWGDDPERPTSVVWLRGGDEGGREAFGSGDPGPVLGWLARRAEGRPIALVAPPSWENSVRSLGGRVELGVTRTWTDYPRPVGPSKVEVRRLALEDGPAFEAVAPSWALRSWGDFSTLIGRGLALGIPTVGGFAALAWTYESDPARDKIGVATGFRFRRLGLGRMVASALLDRVVFDRRRRPIWVTTPSNPASIAIARSLGLEASTDETLLRWTPRRG